MFAIASQHDPDHGPGFNSNLDLSMWSLPLWVPSKWSPGVCLSLCVGPVMKYRLVQGVARFRPLMAAIGSD